VQVLVLQHLPELLDAPVRDQELDPRAVPQPAVAVVAEDRDDALPDVRDLVERHPDTRALRDLRVGREAAADPQVEARAVLGVHDADERDVVDLVRDVLLPRDRGLELARQVGELLAADVALEDRVDRGRGSIASSAAMPATGEPRITRGVSPQASVVSMPRLSRRCQIAGMALDLDPVVLDVLPVRDVGGVARVGLADLAEARSCSVVSAPPSSRTRSMK
jgi:hypothetical protein